ncbi:hypothetical protein LCGC14_1056490 [marine sediment metagenome]|uniref:histidine kinase n=1 Tax=marine sediment metagenome TaxID=412755 RepID=A0A0F9QTD2_9ZZZZ
MSFILILIGTIMLITGIIIIYLGKKRAVPNTYLLGLFPIFHGIHEFITSFQLIQPIILLERIEIFSAILGAFCLLAVTIEFNGAVAKPIGKLISIIGIVIVSYFIFILPDSLIVILSSTTLNFGAFQSTPFRFFQGFFISFISIIVTLFTFIYLKISSRRDSFSIDSRLSRFTAIIISLLTTYALFEGFNHELEVFILLRAFSMTLFMIIPLFFILEMSKASYFSNIEKIRLEQKVTISEEKFQEMLETSSMGLLEFDQKTRKVSYMNPRFLEIIGYSLNELKNIQFPPQSIILPQDLQKLFKNSYEKNFEFKIYDKNGKIKWLLGNRVNQRNAKQEIIKVRFWINDVTMKKEQERRLIAINKLKSDLITRISHELRTPLVSIKGFTELLLNLPSEKLDQILILNLNEIKNGCLRLEKIVKDLFQASYLKSDRLQLQITNENLSELINNCINDIEHLVKDRNQEFILDITENLNVKLEKEKIQYVLINLLSNAINNSPQNGVIKIITKIKNNFVIVSIEDNGIGIKEEEKDYLFKKFSKIERYGQGLNLGIDGIGLGLYISKKIIKIHGGSIWMESQGRNKGSTFHFSIPIIRE